MKLKKKIIICSIIFLFGLSVFFEAFFKGGYIVQAATPQNITIGSQLWEDIETNDGDLISIEVYLSHHDSGDYGFRVEATSLVFDFAEEDCNVEISPEASIFYNGSTNYSCVGTVQEGMLEDSITYEDDEINYSERMFEMSFILNGDDFAPNYYGFINIYFEVYILLDYQGATSFMYDDDVWFISWDMFNSIYTRGESAGDTTGFNRGYSVGYQAGAEAGYNDGYNLGYGDGLDVGYYNGYETGHYDGYVEGEAYGYTTGLDAGYWVGLDEGLNVSGYKEAYDKGVKYTENTASTWFKGVFKGIQGFLDIRIMNVSLGAIILVPFAISFVWFIIRQFRGGGGGD